MDNQSDSTTSPVVIESNGVPVVMAPRAVSSVASWVGSIETYPQFDAGEEIVQDVATSLLNKGTVRRDRFSLAAELENLGAEISFGSHGTRVHFSGRALSRDVERVLELTAEQLSEPSFDPSEFEKSVQRMRASLRRSLSSTSYRAGAALRGRLFTDAHPNYSRDPAEDLDLVTACTIEQVRAFHKSHFSGQTLAVSAAGDFRAEEFASKVGRIFGGWTGDLQRGLFETAGRIDPDPSPREIDIADRDNLDVRIGHAVDVRRNDPDYLALYLGIFALGGNFSARLMQKVRNEMGLTYGIGSGLVGVDSAYEGMWQVSVTLSRDRFEAGIAATMNEIRRFLEAGVTADELDAKKTTICGSYEVGMSTTRGLAHTLHSNLRSGFPAEYLIEFPEAIRGLTLAQVNEAIGKYLDFDRLRVVLAGSIPTQ